MNPFLPSTVTSMFSLIALVPSPVPTTHGIPSSREMIAAWQVTPPSSVTIALALFIAGTISGVVIVVTIMSPSSILSSSWIFLIIFTVPEPVPGLAPNPFLITFMSSTSLVSTFGVSSPSVVIGLDCNINKLPFSIAHSVSCGFP